MIRKRFVFAGIVVAAAVTAVSLVAVASADAQPIGAITVLPNPAVADSDGHVSFSIQGTGFSSLMPLELNSASLDAVCVDGNTWSEQTLKTDFNGNFNTVASGYGCTPGIYCLSAYELTSPYHSVLACLTVESESLTTPTVPVT
jgi:hypothetical protein